MSDLWHCYCDESSIGKPNRYMVVGGLLVRADAAERISGIIKQWREIANMKAELKWKKVSDLKLPEYSAFVSDRIDEIRSGHLAFSALVIDRHQLDHATYNAGDEDIGQSKFFYQMVLRKFVPLMGDRDRLCIFPDVKRDARDFSELQGMLNKGIHTEHEYQRATISKVQPICSKKTNFGQANDLLLGAVGFHANMRQFIPSTRAAKTQLAEHIANSMGLRSLSAGTSRLSTRFSIWRFMLRPRMKKGASKPSRVNDPHVGGSLTSSRGSASEAPPEL
jgi:hypothetical protein